MSLFKYTNTSIRELEFHECNYRFNEEEYNTLSHSPLGIQCEVLSIRVNNQESIINLVKNMMNLRSLNIYWNDEQNSEHTQRTDYFDECCYKTTGALDLLIQWLKDHLPSTCLVVHDPHNVHCVLIWI